MFYGAAPSTFEKAKQLRTNMTEHELLLWEELKENKMLGLRFKAQHPISSFIADFYCHKLKLVIEIDGNSHNSIETREYDLGREIEMQELGIQTIRFKNHEVVRDMENTIDVIKTRCLEIAENSNLVLTPALKGDKDLNFGTKKPPSGGLGVKP